MGRKNPVTAAEPEDEPEEDEPKEDDQEPEAPTVPENQALDVVAESLAAEKQEMRKEVKKEFQKALRHKRKVRDMPFVEVEERAEEEEDEGVDLRALGFWQAAEILGTSPQTSHTTITVSRLEPLEYDGKVAEIVDDILRVELPSDRDTIELMLRQMHGGGLYNCRIRHEDSGTVLKSARGPDRIRIPGPPKFREGKPEDYLSKKRLELEDLDLERRKEEIKHQIEEQRRKLRGEDSDLRQKFEELKTQAMLKETKDAYEKQIAAMQHQMDSMRREFSDSQKRIEALLSEKKSTGQSDLLALLVKSQMDMASSVMQRAMEPRETPDKSETLIEGMRLASEMGVAGKSAEEGGVIPLLTAMAPLIARIAEPKAQPEPSKAKVEAMVVESLQRRSAERRAPAHPPPALPEPKAEPEAVIPEPTEVVKEKPVIVPSLMGECVGLMIQEIEAATPNAPLKVPGRWATTLYKRASDAELEQLVNATAQELATTIAQATPPAQYTKLVELAKRPGVLNWLNQNHLAIRTWWAEDQAKKQVEAEMPKSEANGNQQEVF